MQQAQASRQPMQAGMPSSPALLSANARSSTGGSPAFRALSASLLLSPAGASLEEAAPAPARRRMGILNSPTPMHAPTASQTQRPDLARAGTLARTPTIGPVAPAGLTPASPTLNSMPAAASWMRRTHDLLDLTPDARPAPTDRSMKRAVWHFAGEEEGEEDESLPPPHLPPANAPASSSLRPLLSPSRRQQAAESAMSAAIGAFNLDAPPAAMAAAVGELPTSATESDGAPGHRSTSSVSMSIVVPDDPDAGVISVPPPVAAVPTSAAGVAAVDVKPKTVEVELEAVSPLDEGEEDAADATAAAAEQQRKEAEARELEERVAQATAQYTQLVLRHVRTRVIQEGRYVLDDSVAVDELAQETAEFGSPVRAPLASSSSNASLASPTSVGFASSSSSPLRASSSLPPLHQLDVLREVVGIPSVPGESPRTTLAALHAQSVPSIPPPPPPPRTTNTILHPPTPVPYYSFRKQHELQRAKERESALDSSDASSAPLHVDPLDPSLPENRGRRYKLNPDFVDNGWALSSRGPSHRWQELVEEEEVAAYHKLRWLADIKALSHVPLDGMLQLLSAVVERAFDVEVLLRAGDPGRFCYFVKAGEVQLKMEREVVEEMEEKRMITSMGVAHELAYAYDAAMAVHQQQQPPVQAEGDQSHAGLPVSGSHAHVSDVISTGPSGDSASGSGASSAPRNASFPLHANDPDLKLRWVEIARLGPQAIFGEDILLAPVRRYTAISLTPVWLYEIDSAALLACFGDDTRTTFLHAIAHTQRVRERHALVKSRTRLQHHAAPTSFTHFCDDSLKRNLWSKGNKGASAASAAVEAQEARPRSLFQPSGSQRHLRNNSVSPDRLLTSSGGPDALRAVLHDLNNISMASRRHRYRPQSAVVIETLAQRAGVVQSERQLASRERDKERMRIERGGKPKPNSQADATRATSAASTRSEIASIHSPHSRFHSPIPSPYVTAAVPMSEEKQQSWITVSPPPLRLPISVSPPSASASSSSLLSSPTPYALQSLSGGGASAVLLPPRHHHRSPPPVQSRSLGLTTATEGKGVLLTPLMPMQQARIANAANAGLTPSQSTATSPSHANRAVNPAMLGLDSRLSHAVSGSMMPGSSQSAPALAQPGQSNSSLRIPQQHARASMAHSPARSTAATPTTAAAAANSAPRRSVYTFESTHARSSSASAAASASTSPLRSPNSLTHPASHSAAASDGSSRAASGAATPSSANAYAMPLSPLSTPFALSFKEGSVFEKSAVGLLRSGSQISFQATKQHVARHTVAPLRTQQSALMILGENVDEQEQEYGEMIDTRHKKGKRRTNSPKRTLAASQSLPALLNQRGGAKK